MLKPVIMGLCLAAEGLGMQAAAGPVAVPGGIDLICPVGASVDDTALCAAMTAAIAAAIADRPGWHLQRDSTTGTPASLRIALVLTRADTKSIEGHLEWSAPPGATAMTAPSVAVSTIDAPLSASAYPDFARGLLQVSALPF